MPSLKEQFAEIYTELAKVRIPTADEASLDAILEAATKLKYLEGLVTPTVKRYDFWRTHYCAQTGIPEEDFDDMTDKAMAEAGEPPEQEPSRIILLP